MNNVTTLPGSPPPNQDDPLADFADRVRMNGTSKLELSADEELRGLEETLLRLDHAFPREAMNEETVKRMQADFGIRKRRRAGYERAGHQPWWSPLFRSPIAVTVAACVLIGILLLLTPSLTVIGSSMNGTAEAQEIPLGFLLTLGVVFFLLIFWSNRRK